MNPQTLLVIGAGPKGLAVAAKNKVLREMGFVVPEVILIEKTGVASHWTGRSGYTNGRLELGTSPEKDVGFPYDTQEFSPEVNKAINRAMKAYSWDRYLTEIGLFSEYIDRGRPSPTHAQFAEYLAWVAGEVADVTSIVIGEVTQISIGKGNRWEVECRTLEGLRLLVGDGLMITGPGVPRAEFPILGDRDAVLNVEDFWRRMPELNAGERVCLVGAGENSASIAAALTDLNRGVQVDIVSPSGFVFSRGESYLENRVYSNPNVANWSRLTDADKKNFIRRTDLSVFGQYLQSILNQRREIEVVQGRVIQIEGGACGLDVMVDYDAEVEVRSYRHVVVATGFDHLSFLRGALTVASRHRLSEKLGELRQQDLERRIGRDMAVEGLDIKLHLPMLSRMRQGPGFANLSSLGRLSDQVLSAYVSEAVGKLEAVC